jgi:hypothetical protein
MLGRAFLRRLRTPFWVLLAFAVIDLVVRATADRWRLYAPDDYALKVEGCARERRDFVLLGGSPVAEGLDPDRIAGFHWAGQTMQNGYALGLNGGTASEFYHALKRACPQPPKILVYGITASDLNDSRNEPHGPASLMDWQDYADWLRTRPESRGWVTRKFLAARLERGWALYHHRYGIRLAAADALPSIAPQTAREAQRQLTTHDVLQNGRGYAPLEGFENRRYDVVKATGTELPPFAFLNNYRTGAHLGYVRKIATWCRDRDVQFILVDMPITADLERQYPQVFTQYRTRLFELEGELQVPVIRANRDSVGLSDAGFADTIHLNRQGARVLGDYLRNRLHALGTGGGS